MCGKRSVCANRMSAIKLINNESLAKVRISRIALWRHVGLQSRGSGNFNTSPCSSFFILQLPSRSQTRFYPSPTLIRESSFASYVNNATTSLEILVSPSRERGILEIFLRRTRPSRILSSASTFFRSSIYLVTGGQ